jgi:hypothetical protein
MRREAPVNWIWLGDSKIQYSNIRAAIRILSGLDSLDSLDSTDGTTEEPQDCQFSTPFLDISHSTEPGFFFFSVHTRSRNTTGVDDGSHRLLAACR